MPTECYLKNDLDVEFISTLAKKKIDTKTKGFVQYMNFFVFWTEKISSFFSISWNNTKCASYDMIHKIWGTDDVLNFESYVSK